MKPALVTAAAAAAMTVAATAAPAMASPEVKIENAVARVIVIVEDRTDVGVEITQGDSGLPALSVSRRGDRVLIDGDVANRAIGDCSGDARGATQPGQGAFVEVRRIGRLDMTRAPLIVLRTPRAVSVSSEGAVYGSVGRGATSIDLGNAGCGAWTVANTSGKMSLSVAGSGDVRAGTSESLEISIAGSGDLATGATGSLDVSIAGSGDVNVAAVNGPIDASIAGSGDILIRSGRAPNMDVAIVGAGDVDFRGEAGSLDASLMGAGDVRVATVTGTVDRSIMGGGNVVIGR